VIVIHPGMVKTATSTLQKHGFARHPEVHFLGTPAATDELDWAIREVGRADSLYYDEAAVSDVFRRALAVAPASRTVVLSYENYAFYESKDKGQVGARLKTLFPGAKILFTLRRQQDLVVSLYLTRLRHHIERKTYLPFDEWFRVAAREPHLTALDDLRFQTITSHYVRLFGREQVGILLFEELKAAPESFAHKLAHFLNVNAEAMAALLRGRKENVSISQSYLTFWHHFGHMLPRSVVKLIALRMPRFRGAPARIRLSPKQQTVIHELCAEENARLEAEFGLGLDRYGYCMPNRSPAKR
jgi:hypothetical protein